MAEALIEQRVQGQRILLLVADIARTQLADALQAAGAVCDNLTDLPDQVPRGLPADFLERLDRGQIDWITLTSPSSFVNLLSLLGPQRGERLHAVSWPASGR